MTENYTFHRYQPPETHSYVPSSTLINAVNTALAAEQPLLLTGEPGTGKSTLAQSVAEILGRELFTFHTRSDLAAGECLYSFDALRRFYDAQSQDPRAKDPMHYVRFQAFGKAIMSKKPCVVLIDEIDKASRDFPNDLLDVVEAMRFEIRETGDKYEADEKTRPFVVITTNSEKQLPDPFLRRCVFHDVAFPDATQLARIVARRFEKLNVQLDATHVAKAIARFEKLRTEPLEKKPATAELLVWLRVLDRANCLSKVETAKWAELFSGTIAKTPNDLERVLSLDREKPNG